MFIRLTLFAGIFLTACTPRLMPPPSPTPIQGDTTDMNPVPSSPVPQGLQSLIEKAKENLSTRLSIPISQIQLADARDVVWSNSSLGCPQPGMTYAEVLTPSYLIFLNVNNKDYEYHTGKSTKRMILGNKVNRLAGKTCQPIL